MKNLTSSAEAHFEVYLSHPSVPNWRALIDSTPTLGRQHEWAKTGTLVRLDRKGSCLYRIVSPARHQLRDGRRYFSVRLVRFNRAAHRWNSTGHNVEVAL